MPDCTSHARLLENSEYWCSAKTIPTDSGVYEDLERNERYTMLCSEVLRKAIPEAAMWPAGLGLGQGLAWVGCGSNSGMNLTVILSKIARLLR